MPIDTADVPVDPFKAAKDQKERSITTWHPDKVSLAHKWIEEESTLKVTGFVRGAIHYCALGENIGSEQNKERPVIIVSHDTINSTSGNVLIAPLTETLKKKRKQGVIVLTKDGKPTPKYSSHLFLFKDKYDFLAADSAIMTEEIKSISKARLKNHRGTVADGTDLNRLDVRIKWSLGLS